MFVGKNAKIAFVVFCGPCLLIKQLSLIFEGFFVTLVSSMISANICRGKRESLTTLSK